MKTADLILRAKRAGIVTQIDGWRKDVKVEAMMNAKHNSFKTSLSFTDLRKGEEWVLRDKRKECND